MTGSTFEHAKQKCLKLVSKQWQISIPSDIESPNEEASYHLFAFRHIELHSGFPTMPTQVSNNSRFSGELFSSINKHHAISLKELNRSITFGKTSLDDNQSSFALLHFQKKWIESSSSMLHQSHVATCKTFLLTRLVFNGKMSQQALQAKCLILWGTLICHRRF